MFRIRYLLVFGLFLSIGCVASCSDDSASPQGDSGEAASASESSGDDQGVPSNQAKGDESTDEASNSSDPGAEGFPEQLKPKTLPMEQLKAWAEETAEITSFIPKKLRSQDPVAGYWKGNAFLEEATEGALAAVHAGFKSTKTKLAVATTVDEKSEDDLKSDALPVNELGAMNHDQSAEFILIAAGEAANDIKQEIDVDFYKKGWEPGKIALMESGSFDQISFWKNQSFTAYTYVFGKYVLYVAEREGYYEIGGGRGSSFGAQLITQTLASIESVHANK